MSALTALRGTRPDSVRSGGGIGSPTISTSLLGRSILAPLGIIASLPPMPIGMIGTSALAAT